MGSGTGRRDPGSLSPVPDPETLPFEKAESVVTHTRTQNSQGMQFITVLYSIHTSYTKELIRSVGQKSGYCQEMSRVVRKPTFWFPTWSDTNQAVQLQKMARGLKFRS